MAMNNIEDKDEIIGKSIYAVNSPEVIKKHENVFDGKTGNYRGPFKSIQNYNHFVQLTTVPMMDNEDKVAGGITIINDITSEITAKEKMVRNAYYDLLTNIPNRHF